MNTITLIAIALFALIPTTAIVFCIYVNDCLEKEPIPLLVALFAAGIVSAFVAALIPRHNLMMVALVEELCKFLVLILLTFKSKAFDCKFDGIVYAVCVGAGFAFLENVFYYAQFFMVGKMGGTVGAGRAFSRFLPVAVHAICAVIIGYFYSAGKEFFLDKKLRKGILNIALGYLLAVIYHGVWDMLCMYSYKFWMIAFLLVFIIASILVAIYVINRVEKGDYYFDDELAKGNDSKLETQMSNSVENELDK